ncbi:MAG TPA: hypothetical protein VN937_12455 [Blastocatellia bacterium]|nr:hypothetical protein [Blastocatellia bacterium]
MAKTTRPTRLNLSRREFARDAQWSLQRSLFLNRASATPPTRKPEDLYRKLRNDHV